MSKNIIDEKNISRAFSTLKDYQKTKIVKAISEYLAVNERNANKAFDSCLKCDVENCLDSGIPAGKLHFATRAKRIVKFTLNENAWGSQALVQMYFWSERRLMM